MAIFECPLCCAEKFSDACSLENHLLDLCENITCPICEFQFKTIHGLALHLGQGCEYILNTSEHNEALKIDSSDEQIISTSVDCQQTENINVNEQGGNNNLVTVTDTLSVTSSFPYASGSSRFSQNVSNQQICEKEAYQDVSIARNECHKSLESLYSCSVCNITFTSVEDHLRKFHKDENVLVDNEVELNLVEIAEGTNAGDNSKELNFSGVDLLPKDTNSVFWENEDVNNLLIVNWQSKDFEEDASKIELNHSKDLDRYSLNEPNSMQSCGNFYYYSPKSDFRTKDMIDKSPLCFTNSGAWSSMLLKYPLATFLILSEEDPVENYSIACEYKPYVFNDHRVRVLTFKTKGDLPSLEDIPFPDKPPDTIVPVLEQTTDPPKDLIGSYSVMWPCHLCGALAYHWSDLAKHHCSSSSKCFPCTICKKTFQSRRSLNNHFSVFHKILRSMLGCYQCPLCPAKVHTSSHLEKHLAMHKKNDLIKCNICECKVQKLSYSEHIRAHGKDGTLSLVCQLCNRPFKGENELSMHIPQCHLQEREEDNLKCSVCTIVFTDVSALREHMVSHDIPIKPHLCIYCPKSYHRLIDKVIHERVHTKSKPFSCSECERCFRLRHSLIAHMRIHTGERPFKCSQCDRTFRTKHLQRSHNIIHMGQNLYKCKHCNKHFRTKERIEQHEKSHKKPFVCSECKRTFYSLSFAKRHMENHKRNELKFTCNMCPNMFTQAAYLESHLRVHHGLDTLTSISISTQKTYEHMEESVTPMNT